MLVLEVNKNNCDYIGNIKRGITYKREVAEILSEEVQRLGSDPQGSSDHRKPELSIKYLIEMMI